MSAMVDHGSCQLPDPRALRRAVEIARHSSDGDMAVAEDAFRCAGALELIHVTEDRVFDLVADARHAPRVAWTPEMPFELARIAHILGRYHRVLAHQEREAARPWKGEEPEGMEMPRFDKVEAQAAKQLETESNTYFASTTLSAVLDLLAAVVASIEAAARNVRRHSTAGGRLARLPSVALTPRLAARPRALMSA